MNILESGRLALCDAGAETINHYALITHEPFLLMVNSLSDSWKFTLSWKVVTT